MSTEGESFGGKIDYLAIQAERYATQDYSCYFWCQGLNHTYESLHVKQNLTNARKSKCTLFVKRAQLLN